MNELNIAQLQAENLALRTELKLMRVPTAKIDDRFEKLLDILPAGVVVINDLGEVSLCNPAAQSLLCNPLVGLKWRDVVSLCFAPQADDGHEVSLKDGRRVSIDTRALLDNQGQLVLLSNLTETRRLQGRLAHMQRLSEMGKMMASLAHQIRTPLSAALLYSSHLVRSDLSQAQRIKFASKAKTRLLNIEQQISDMLIFARGDNTLTDKLTVPLLFQSLEDALDIPLAQHDADCDLNCNVGDLEILCNKDVLVGAIVNVVVNALQSVKSGAEIKINANVHQSWLVISVIDNGPGMSPQALAQAQQPFYTTKSHGTGLGLSVAHEVAKAHQGRFEMASELGKGTVAGFWLPIDKD
ncbi:MAG: PAS domain-containing protein [Oceanospirillaceae bacterium]|nr:PAS domain-containing protein [Oceanospirillaceae bacterium]